MDTGLLLLRLVFGLALAAHGSQKLFGSFGGGGIAGAGQFFASLGFHVPRLFAFLAGVTEFAGGLALAAGLLTPITTALILADLGVAVWTVHRGKGFFAQAGGFELPALYAVATAALAFTGSGAFSMDAWLGLTAPEAGGVLSLAVGAAGALAVLLTRRSATRPPAPRRVTP